MWTTPVLSATGDLISAALYRINYDNLRYLKGLDGTTAFSSAISVAGNIGITGTLGTPAHGQPANSIDTIYQNATSHPILVIISVTLDDTENASLFIGATSPPATDVASVVQAGATSVRSLIVCMIPPSYYYKLVSTTGTPTVAYWVESALY